GPRGRRGRGPPRGEAAVRRPGADPLRGADEGDPERDVRARRAGHPPAEPPRLLADAPLPRVRRGLPVPELLRRADLSRAWLRRLRSRDRPPRLPLLRRLDPPAGRVPELRVARPDAERLRHGAARGAGR